MSKAIAHVSEDGREHGLYEHLIGAAEKAADFAAEFGSGEWGYLAGFAFCFEIAPRGF
ncbi:MAG: hypothetical protein L0Y62_04150 [Nitrospirae bacterium]|nr:hypothetical protein [Nitrospirota bacterium]